MTKRIPLKRRRQQLTNYHKRLKLVISRKPRFVVRISNKYVNAQLINYKVDGDETIAAFNSKKLKDYGFKPGKNLQNAYLCGYIAGLMSLSKGVKSAVLDSGLRPSTKNSRIYAALKGLIDAGVKVPHGEGILPSDELIKKKDLSKVIEKIKVKKPVVASKKKKVKSKK